MTRQRFRRFLLLVAMIIFPVTIYYHSPVLIVHGAFEGLLVGSFFLFATQLISGIFLGRAFCGWACAGGGIGEHCFAINSKQAPGGKTNWIKWFIWLPWIGLVAYFLFRSGVTLSPNFTFGTWYGISVHGPISYIVYFIIVSLIAGLCIAFGKRSFCHHACWMAPFMITGQRVGALLRIPRLRLIAEPDSCKQCHKCDKGCPMSLPVSDMVTRGVMADDECILCGSCIDDCKTQAIRFGFSSSEPEYQAKSLKS